MNNSMIPQYSTVLFTEVWDSAEEFKTDLAASAFAGCMQDGSTQGQPDNVSLLYYLLYSKYGNNPIANNDINQFKYKIFSVMYQYGPTWEKKIDIQAKIRNLTETDLMTGAKAVYNTALNPGTAPSTASTEELTYINSQNTTNLKRGKMEAYGMLWDMLDDSLTAKFIDRFAICFKKFVYPEQPLLYVSEDEEDE